MKDAYHKCINLFSRENSRVLIITHENNDEVVSVENAGAGVVDFISLTGEGGDLSGLVDTDAMYDLVILDQVSDAPLLSEKLAAIWKTREEMFAALSTRMHPQGSLIIFTQNAVNLRQLSFLRHALTNLFKRTVSPGTFLRQFTRELTAVGFLKFDYFYVYPDFDSFAHLISTERHAFQAVLSLKYGLPLNAIRRPKFWLRWVLSNSQLDRWLFRCQIIWVRK